MVYGSYTWLNSNLCGLGYEARTRPSTPTQRFMHNLLGPVVSVVLNVCAPTKLWRQNCTRTTKTPAFLGYPAASWLPILLSHIGSQLKRRQSQSYKLKEFAYFSNYWIFKQTLHATHLLKMPDEICKYEMNPTSIVEERTERIRFRPQTDRRTDGQTDRRTRWNPFTPLSTSLKRGV